MNDRTCADCGSPLTGALSRLYCSDRCKWRVKARRRYAAMTPEQRTRKREREAATYRAEVEASGRTVRTLIKRGPVCEVGGCAGKHFALGMCINHYRRDRWLKGLDGSTRDVVEIGALRKPRGNLDAAPDQVVLLATRSGSLIFPLCPRCGCHLFRLEVEADLRDCPTCDARFRLNPEEVEWAVSGMPSIRVSRRRSQSTGARTLH